MCFRVFSRSVNLSGLLITWVFLYDLARHPNIPLGHLQKDFTKWQILTRAPSLQILAQIKIDTSG